MARSVLEDARRLAKRGRHAAVISLLESRLPLFRDSHSYYFLLGSACLRTGDIGGATTYLKRAEQLDPHDLDTKLSLAALHLRRGEIERALSIYLSVLDENPEEGIARRALAFLKRPDSAERALSLGDQGKLEAFMPRVRGLPLWLLPLGLIIAILLAGALSYPLVERGFSILWQRTAPRPDVAAISLTDSDRTKPVGNIGNSRYILTEKEALASFDRAKARFQEYRDNAAIVDINRILDSNASPGLKEKARTLLAFVAAPDWRSLRDIPAYADVVTDPGLYRNCSVIWKGRAANINGSSADRRFDFLVGYSDRNRLDGIVKVKVVDGALAIPSDAPFELLASVSLDSGSPILLAIALHELSSSK